MTYHNTDNLRLEIEVPTDGLPNLVQNPDGRKGAWGWVTPVTNTLLTADQTALWLQFKTTVSQAAWWTSEHLPVAAGQYVGARFDTVSGTTGGNVKVRFEWYNASKTLLSSSVQTAFIGVAAGTSYVPAVQAPASTAYVKIRFDLFNGSVNPTAGQTYTVRNVMVTYAATSTTLGSRRNMIPNPAFETNATGWSAGIGGSTVARVTTPVKSGVGALRLSTASGISYNTAMTDVPSGSVMAVFGGKNYAFAAEVRSAAVVRQARVWIQWFGPGFASLGISYGAKAATSTSAWTRVTGAGTAPSGAVSCQVAVEVTTLSGNFPAGELHYIDEVICEQLTTVGAYFDGSSTNSTGLTHAWTGTAHASASTQATANYPFWEPNGWRNILGPTHDIKISRAALDVGLMSATVLDSLLDPASTSDVRPGKKIRLVADADLDGLWLPIMEAETSRANVNYRDGVAIELTATDNIAVLANQAEPRGVANLADLPFILEGRGVPWSIRGSGNQVVSAAVVATNDNASVLDQVAITRDTNLAYAWVDRSNVLQVINQADPRGAGLTTFTDVPGALTTGVISYSDLDIGFDTDEVINEVTVKFLRYTASTASTEEIAYGPYRDQGSIDTWGVRSAEFTIQGTESVSAIAAYAASILTANAQPVRKARSLTFPVLDLNSMKVATTLDLYDNVKVTFKDKLTAAPYVVTGVEHSITPGAWLVTVTFGSTASVASPTVTPSPTGTTTGTDVNIWSTLAVTAPYTNASTPALRYLKDAAGNVHIRGAVNVNSATNGASCATLPAGFRPSSDVRFTNDTTPVATSSNRYVVGADGTVRPYSKTGTPTVHILDCCYTTL